MIGWWQHSSLTHWEKIQNLSNQKKKKDSADTRRNDKNFTESHLLVKRPKANKFQAYLLSSPPSDANLSPTPEGLIVI